MRRLFCLLLLLTLPLASGVQRIISTAPSITQTLFALGLGDRVVGVTDYCHYPPEADKRTRIGNYLNPDIETIVALHPDLVVVAKLPNNLSDQLTRLHIRSIVVDHSTIDDVFRSDQAIAQVAGEPASATRLNQALHAGLDQVRSKTGNAPKFKSVVVVGHNPGALSGLFVAGARSYFTEVLEIAGGQNVFSDTKILYPKVSLEEVLRRDPDFIFEISGADGTNEQTVRRLWAAEKSLRAVQSSHVFPVPADLFIVPGPRVVEASRYLARLLHPNSGL